MTLEEMVVKVAEVDQRAKSNTRRLDKMENLTEAVQSLATAVEVMVREQSHQTEAMGRIEDNVNKLSGKVEVLEQKPGKRYDSIVDKIAWLLLGGMIAFVFSQIGIPL